MWKKYLQIEEFRKHAIGSRDNYKLYMSTYTILAAIGRIPIDRRLFFRTYGACKTTEF